jgi:lipoate-protein ligase A
LNYSLILRISESGPLASITATNGFILERHQAALETVLGTPVVVGGHTDLAVGGLKFCGNAQRRKRLFLIFHGCFLLGLDLGLVEKALLMPSKQPGYRANRSHTDFLVNLEVPASKVKAALAEAWRATEPLSSSPLECAAALVRERYGTEEWNRGRDSQ